MRKTLIWAIAGIGASVASNVGTFFATRKLYLLVQREEARLGRKMTRKEIFRLGWKLYGLPAALVVASGVALLHGEKLANRQMQEAAGNVRDISRDRSRIESGDWAELFRKEEYRETGHGEAHCVDLVLGIHYLCDPDYILASGQEILDELERTGKPVRLNVFLEKLGVKNVKIGERLGFTKEVLINVSVFSMETEFGRVHLVDYNVEVIG